MKSELPILLCMGMRGNGMMGLSIVSVLALANRTGSISNIENGRKEGSRAL